MVENTGATVGAGDVRPLNRPHPLAVKTNDDGQPVTVRVRGLWFEVEAIVDRWRIDDEWWREQPICRIYYECLVDQGLRATVFQDRISTQWYLQRV